MTYRTRFALMLLMSALLVPSALAQDSTSTPTAVSVDLSVTLVATDAAPATTVDTTAQATQSIQSTAEALPEMTHIVPEAQEFPPATEEETETSVGGMTLIHPKTWFATVGPDGKALLTNIDLLSLPANAEMPAETVLAQIQIFSTSQLPLEIGAVEYATDILEALPSAEGQPKPPITEVDVNGIILGRGDFSQPDNENVIYIRLLDDETFMLAVVGSITEGEVIKNEAAFQRAFASVTVITDAPFAEDAARYEGIAQSTSEAGFPQLGDPNAPVKIIEIGSFDCPACRSFHDLAFPVLLERIQKGEVFFTYIPVFGTGSLPRGQRAAVAALCVAQQDPTLFWTYHDGLFGWQDFGTLAFLDARLQKGAETLGLDMTVFDECLQTQGTLSIIENAATFVRTLAEFTGTPTVLLNGEQVNWSRLPTLIDDAVAASQAPASTAEAGATVEPVTTAEPTAIVVPAQATPTATAQP